MTSPNHQFAIPEPYQLKCGGWVGTVLAQDQTTILMETFQPTRNFAFTQCLYWCVAENHKTEQLFKEQQGTQNAV